MEEEWRETRFYGYEVSNLGRVRSFRPIHGQGPLISIPRIMKPKLDRYGYYAISLTLTPGGKRYYLTVNRLVLEAFKGPCPPGMQSCHNNGIRTDNRLDNLRWDTNKNNMFDQVAHGTACKGELNGRSVLTELDVIDILKKLKAKVPMTVIARQYKISTYPIYAIKKGLIWKNVPRL